MGREGELGELRVVLAEALSGQGRLVFINDAVIRLAGVTKYYGRQLGVSDLDL